MDETGPLMGIRHRPGTSRRLTGCLLADIQKGGDLLYILVRAPCARTPLSSSALRMGFPPSIWLRRLRTTAWDAWSALKNSTQGDCGPHQSGRIPPFRSCCDRDRRCDDHVERFCVDRSIWSCSTAGRTYACPFFGPWSRLSAGALIVADDINLPSMRRYLEYVRTPANGYSRFRFLWKTAWKLVVGPPGP